MFSTGTTRWYSPELPTSIRLTRKFSPLCSFHRIVETYGFFSYTTLDICLLIFGCTACRILVPRPGIKPTPPALKAWSLDHWTTREVPTLDIFNVSSHLVATFSPNLCHPPIFSKGISVVMNYIQYVQDC